jgi:uncharacterized membrane protein YfcA
VDSLGQALLVALVGVVAGVANVSAGGGSLLTVPMLIFTGLPGPVANGTNRIALVLQNAVAIRTFRGGGVSEWRRSLPLTLAALPGVALGAWLGVVIDDHLFRRLLGVVLLVMLGFVLSRPRSRGVPAAPSAAPRAATLVSFAFIGFYSGFIQAGVGFLFIFALVTFEHLDLVRTNAVKVTAILAFQVLALAVYAWGGKVVWIPGLTLGIGNMLGGWLGVRLSLSRGERYLRPAIAVCVVAFAVKLIFFP